MGFRTWVRFPSGPLDHEVANPYPTRIYKGLRFAVYENVFALIVNLENFNDYQATQDDTKKAITFADIKAYVKQKYDVDVSNSSITQIKKKCGIESFDSKYVLKSIDDIKTDKEKLILDAFVRLGIVKV